MQSFAARQSMHATSDRMSVMETEAIERQYISEYYAAEQFEAQKSDGLKIDRQNSLLSPSIEAQKMLGKLTLAAKIKYVLYCANGGFLCVGLQNGTIITYHITVESLAAPKPGFRDRKYPVKPNPCRKGTVPR